MDAAAPIPQAAPAAALPQDDPRRHTAVARRTDAGTGRHVAAAGGVYTILLAGEDTAGRYTLVEMQVPPGGGPPPHRHDFEEMLTVPEGEVAITSRGATTVVRVGDSVNVPANAPHAFRSVSDRPARLPCTCAPAGQERFPLAVGDPVPDRASPPPALTDAERAERRARAAALAAGFRTELPSA